MKRKKQRVCQRATILFIVMPRDLDKLDAMRRALCCKFSTHAGLRDLLLSTGHSMLIEASPKDGYWGCGCDQKGDNHLGQLLMEIRDELKKTSSTTVAASLNSVQATST